MTWTPIAEQTSRTRYQWRETGQTKIEDARHLWDLGLIELCHRRTEGGFELVMIERRRRVDRPEWFGRKETDR